MKKLLFQKELFVRYQSTNFCLQRAVNKYQKLTQRKKRRQSLNPHMHEIFLQRYCMKWVSGDPLKEMIN